VAAGLTRSASWWHPRQTTMPWATPLDSEHPGRKTLARAHLEEDGRLLRHRHSLIDDKGDERTINDQRSRSTIIELRMTRK